jgi:hypothetical protein
MPRIGLLLLLIGVLFSCDPNISFRNVVPQNVDKFATDFIADIKQMKIEDCMQRVIPEMKTQAWREYLTNTYRNIQDFQIDSARIINARTQTLIGNNGFTTYSIGYEYFIKEKYLYFSVAIREQKGKLLISGFDGRLLETSLTEIHSFTLDKKGFAHYLFLVLAIIISMFIVVTLIFAIRTKLTKKWLWIIGILFGFAKFTINWTTGQIGFQLISVQMLGAGFSKQGLVAPWTISITLPIVAIYFWTKVYWDKRDNDLIAKTNEQQGVTG